MSLYHHVANKDDLLDGMVDAVMAEFGIPTEAGDWATHCATAAGRPGPAASRHPWAIGLLGSRTPPVRRPCTTTTR